MTTTNPKDLIGTKKPPLSLVPPAGLIHTSMAMADGARKYGPYNWRENAVQANIYIDAAMRHLQQWFDGEECAEDSGAHHLAHASACCFILLDAIENGCLVDNRPKAGTANELIKRLTQK